MWFPVEFSCEYTTHVPTRYPYWEIYRLYLYWTLCLVVATTIIIDIRSWNIKTNLIEKVSCPDKITVIIRKGYVLSLSSRQNYYFLLATYLGYYFMSYESKVISHRFTWFWILCPVWIRAVMMQLSSDIFLFLLSIFLDFILDFYFYFSFYWQWRGTWLQSHDISHDVRS